MALAQVRNYQGIPAQERKEQRRQQLLNAAIRVYGTLGFRAAKVKLVCQEAGLTERYFYESYTNSEELLCACCGYAMHTMRELALEAVSQSDGTPSGRLRAASFAYFSYLRSHPHVARVTLLEMEGVSPEVDDFLGAELQKTTDLIRDLLFGDGRTQPIKELDPDLLARGILGALYQLAKEWSRAGFEQPVEVMTRHMQAIAIGVLSA